MLADHQIRDCLKHGSIVVEPIDDLDKRLQPASLDVRLGAELLIFSPSKCSGHDEVDPRRDQHEQMWEPYVLTDRGAVIYPGDFLLGTTIERVTLDPSHAARIEGKSSVGRLGLRVHATAGFIDPGFDGQVTLEIDNACRLPIRLYPGMPIAQLAFDKLDEPAENPYQGKYSGQQGPQASRYHRNWDGSSW